MLNSSFSLYALDITLQDEISQIQEVGAVAPLVQSTNALATWLTDEVGPLSDHNALKNNVVLLDDAGNFSGTKSILFDPSASIPASSSLWVNSGDDHLYHGAVDLEAIGGGNVSGPGSSTVNSIAVFDNISGTLLAQASISTDASGDLILSDTNGKVLMRKGLLTPQTILDTNADFSTALGYYAGGTDGVLNSNTSFGYETLGSFTTGNDNTAFGMRALFNLVSGSFNTALGKGAGINLINGSGNVYVGAYGVDGDTYTIRIGDPLFHTKCFCEGVVDVAPVPFANKVVTIDPTTHQLSSLENNFIYSNFSPDPGAIPFWSEVGDFSLETTTFTYEPMTGSLLLNNYTSTLRCAKGNEVPNGDGSALIIIDCNNVKDLAVGHHAGLSSSVVPTAGNITMGAYAGANLGSAINNVLLGYEAGKTAGLADSNTFVGYQAGTLAQCSSSVAIGKLALQKSTGTTSVAVGNNTLTNVIAGNSNIALGDNAGSSLTSGSNNIYAGNVGQASESGVIRIGTSGTHNAVYVPAVYGTTLIQNQTYMSTVNSSNQLGYLPLQAVGKALFNNFTTPYTRTLVLNTPTEVQATFTLTTSNSKFSTSAGRLTWLGPSATWVSFNSASSFKLASGTNVTAETELRTNGLTNGNPTRRLIASATDYQVSSGTATLLLNTNDYVSFFITNLTGSQSIDFGSINLNGISLLTGA